MAPPTLVVRSFEDPATPTAATLSTRDRMQHVFSDSDYDKGDILDELLQETPRATLPPTAVTPLSQDALRRVPAPSVVAVPDDSASTCSSTTTGATFTDADANDDSASITSASVSGRSATSPPSSCGGDTTADATADIARKTGGGRRRRRQNRGLAAVAATSCASDAGSESPSVTTRPRKNSARPRSAAAQDAKDDAASPLPAAMGQPQSAAGPTSPNRKSGGRNKGRSKGHKSALVAEARRSRHPTLQIGLDLDVELQLKSKVRGDICLTLVLEETQNVASRASPEIRRNAAGQYVAYDEWEDVEDVTRSTPSAAAATKKQTPTRDASALVADDVEEVEVTRIRTQRPGPGTQRRELCHLRVGRLNLARRWWMDGYEMIGHIPPPVVAGLAVTMPVAGFAVGWLTANWGGWLW